jgi:hypothetical protein
MSLSGVTFKEFHCSSKKELHNLKLTKVLPDAKVGGREGGRTEREITPPLPSPSSSSPPRFS